MNIQNISQINPAKELTQTIQQGSEETGKSNFASELNRSINQVNDLLADADKATTDLAIGRTENIHEAMIATEKAESAIKFLMQVRNKALDAYREILRMQI